MVKTTDKKVKNKQEARLKLRRTSSPSSSSSHASLLMRKRSHRISSTQKPPPSSSANKTNHKQDDNLSIYSREEDDDDDTTAGASTTAVANNKSDDSESEFTTYKFTPQKRGRKPKKKISKLIIESTEDEEEEDEIESEQDEDETQNESKYSVTNHTQMNKFTQITFMSKKYTLDTFEPIDLICGEDLFETLNNKNLIVNKQSTNQQVPELPKVNVEIKTDYPISLVEYKMPSNFIKYVETTPEELDEEVEYDMDEEDTVWLDVMNEQRLKEDNIDERITQEQFEILMDRLEKESYFQSSGHHHKPSLNLSNNQSHSLETSLNQTRNDSTNEDALCCICLDGECLNTNAILFCDMCNLAVHQECYGVPYIPEGQWLCRRCIQSPSSAVNCILCPNRYGAFKQTDRGLWCHVICAIWIPEVHFANTVFLEPVIGIENIDRARWKLMCYICRKKNAGACIQCDKNNCYTAFHVTCAQQAGLYMNINEEPITTEKYPRKKNKNNKKNNKNRQTNQSMNTSNGSVELRRRAYCDIHTPIETLSPRTRKSIQSAYSGVECEEAMKRAQRMRMKKARKILAERRNAPPVVSMPVIPKERCDEILNKYLNIEQKEKFFSRLMNYWTLKRYSRNGVPMLRRLQQAPGIKKKDTSHHHNTSEKIDDADDLAEVKRKLKEQLVYWKKMRQDLETTRLLMELIRKRERIKRELIRIDQLRSMYELNSFNGIFLQRILDILRDLDKREIFHEPVDFVEVPTYLETIQNPMDFSTMQAKLNRIEYENFNQFEADFELIISNCMLFNQKNSHYYKAAVKLKEQTVNIFKQAKRLYATNFESGSDSTKSIASPSQEVAWNVLTVNENEQESIINMSSINDLSIDKTNNSISSTNKKKSKKKGD